jgi:hypothetical protein
MFFSLLTGVLSFSICSGTISSVVRTYYISVFFKTNFSIQTLPNKNLSKWLTVAENVSMATICSLIEAGIFILAGCLATMRQLFTQVGNRVGTQMGAGTQLREISRKDSSTKQLTVGTETLSSLGKKSWSGKRESRESEAEKGVAPEFHGPDFHGAESQGAEFHAKTDVIQSVIHETEEADDSGIDTDELNESIAEIFIPPAEGYNDGGTRKASADGEFAEMLIPLTREEAINDDLAKMFNPQPEEINDGSTWTENVNDSRAEIEEVDDDLAEMFIPFTKKVNNSSAETTEVNDGGIETDNISDGSAEMEEFGNDLFEMFDPHDEEIKDSRVELDDVNDGGAKTENLNEGRADMEEIDNDFDEIFVTQTEESTFGTANILVSQADEVNSGSADEVVDTREKYTEEQKRQRNQWRKSSTTLGMMTAVLPELVIASTIHEEESDENEGYTENTNAGTSKD